MPSVLIPHSFFIEEKKRLYNWQTDFWRELLQNSIDAGSFNISISVIQDGNTTICRIDDDGIGMNNDVLENVYFKLGETTKTGDSIGGFGRARIMTCFGNASYSIQTQNNKVFGSGANYTITTTEEYYNGCSIIVHMNDATAEQMLHTLRSYLLYCSLRISIKINGTQYNEVFTPGRKIKEFSFADVRVNNVLPVVPNLVIFRVNGLVMFTRRISQKKQVVVDIHPSKSREVLSADRNRFAGSYQAEIDNWINTINIENRSSLKYKPTTVQSVISGTGILKSVRKRLSDEESVTLNDSVSHNLVEVSASISASAEINPSRMDEIEIKSRMGYNDSIPAMGNKLAPWLPDILILDETGNPAMDKHISRFHPDNWVREVKVVRGQSSPYNKGREALRLLMAFRIAASNAVDILMDHYNLSQFKWTVGWYFGENQAYCVSNNDVHIYCLNPLDENNRSKYRLTDRSCLLQILALAKHEVAHSLENGHNESWGSIYTYIDSRFDTSKVLRDIKDGLAILDI